MKKGTIVVATFGHNDVTDRPFSFLYDFGRITDGGIIVYRHLEHNTQDELLFDKGAIRIATDDDMKTLFYGK